MKLFMVSVFDSALGAFMRPFATPSIGAAVRSFGDEIKRPDSEMGRHPTDYQLFTVGEFDDVTGQFTSCAAAQIARGADYVS